MTEHKNINEVIAKIKKIDQEEKIEFYFVPSENLINRLVRGDEKLSKFTSSLKPFIVNIPREHGIAINTKMVIDYLSGSLDENNKYVLSMGEIRVRNANKLFLKGLNFNKQ